MENKVLPKRSANVNKKYCVACGTCIKECPKSAVTVWRGCYAIVAESECIGCGKCAGVCPVGCVTIKIKEDDQI